MIPVAYKNAILMMVDPLGNHNKRYEMKIENNLLVVSYGREGSKMQRRTYPASSFQRKYDEKIKKGYMDVTDKYEAVVTDIHAPIKEKNVKILMDEICNYSNTYLKKNYTINTSQVTHKMAREARECLTQISHYGKQMGVQWTNQKLLKLYAILPRKMGNVSDCLLHTMNDFPSMLQREYDLLEAMEARVVENRGTSVTGTTILDEMGITITEVDDSTAEMIKRKMKPETAMYFDSAYRVHNKKLDARFEKCKTDNGYTDKDVHFLYHGSRNANIYGLLKQGLVKRPASATYQGSMFGDGCYLADRALKSIRYTSLKVSGANYVSDSENTAYLFVAKAMFKNPMHIWKREPKHGLLSEKNIAPYDAVFAHKSKHPDIRQGTLVNNEYVIFDNSQITWQYIIKLKK